VDQEGGLNFTDLKIHPPLPTQRDTRIGVLGSGFIVSDCHLVAYRKAGFNPVAIASRNPDNARKTAARHGIETVYDTYDQLLDDAAIAVLDIAVPPNAQVPLILEACARGTVKGILAQKPLGMHYAEALRAVEACERAGIALAVNQNMRFDQAVRAAKNLLDQNYLGEPIIASIEMRAIPHWMPWQADLGWVTLRIMSIHHLDTMRYWFGEPERIYCSVRSDPRTTFPHRDGICAYILEYANGLRCVCLDDTWTGPAKENCPADNYIRFRIEGREGLAVGDIGWCKNPYTTPSTLDFARKGDTDFQRPRWTESWFPDAFIGTMADLLIAVERGAPPTLSGRDNLRTMALVDAAYLSAQEHRAVSPAEVSAKS
jgi:predicted dehydrogenase